MENVRFLPCGDQAVTVEWGSTIDEHINRQVHAFARKVEALSHPAITEVVPTYRSATVHYRPEVLSYEELKHLLAPLAQGSAEEAEELPVVEIPVCYGGEYGPDLLEVAQHCSLTPEEVIARHTAPTYRIYMLGFTPGFPYLGGMDPSIAAPRRKEPRIHIPAGSVGLAAGSSSAALPCACSTPRKNSPFCCPPVQASASRPLMKRPSAKWKRRRGKEHDYCIAARPAHHLAG